MHSIDTGRLGEAAAAAEQRLVGSRTDGGHWIGQLSASALSTATAISTLSFYLEAPGSDPAKFPMVAAQINQGLNWLRGQQNSDGGFGDTALNYSNIATSMLVVAAIHAAGRIESFHDPLEQATGYIESQGSIDGLRKRYGKDKTFAVPILANCAMAGMVPWKEVSALPFEAACVPQRFYHLLRLPVVSYAIPALVAIGQAKYLFDPPWDPLRRTVRKLSIARSLKVLHQMQPASGGYLEAVPLTSFVTMSLIKTGREDHPVAQQGIQFLLDSFCQEPDDDLGQSCGSWPIDTNLAMWSTTLSINALANAPLELRERIGRQPESWQACLDWLLKGQYQNVHPFTGSPPGGWGWTDLSGAVPDADDTPGAMIALKNLLDTGHFEAQRERIESAAERGIDWLLRLQNRDRGWPTFCRGWGTLPFDRSGSDITAHVIRGLLAWKGELAHVRSPGTSQSRVERAISGGFAYLEKNQQSDGSWLPLWFGNQDQTDDINPFYGTAKVLAAYLDAGRFNTQPAQFGLDWLASHQNADGGWGGGASVTGLASTLGHSSVEETALCCQILLSAQNDRLRQSGWRGIEWLIQASESGDIQRCWPIGFYFAKLWYYEKSYPLIFAAAALARARQSASAAMGPIK